MELYGLYDANGRVHCDTVCLGCSASGDDQSVYKGNTPTGIYTGYLGKIQADTQAYGPYKVIMMNGIAGNIYNYRNTRSSIWIHGGRSQEVLQPTNGCVRVFNNYQEELQNDITALDTVNGHEGTGYIYISDPDQSYT